MVLGSPSDALSVSTSTRPSALITRERTCTPGRADASPSASHRIVRKSRSRSSARRTFIFSVRCWSSSRSKLCQSTQYKKPEATISRTKAEPAYQAESRNARLFALLTFENIAHSPHRADQLSFEWVIHFGAQASYIHVHHVGAAVEVNAPYLFRDQRLRDYFAGTARQQGEKQKLLRCQIQTLAC